MADPAALLGLSERLRIGPFSELAELIEPTLRDLGFELVVARVMGSARPTLQVMAEPLDRERTMTVDDCAQISRAVSAVLDVADPFGADPFTLEVSSPGIDRPLVRAADYDRFSGLEAKVETSVPVAGNRRRFTGVLHGTAGDAALVEVGDGEVLTIPLVTVKKAKLVLTEALLRSHAAKAARNGGASAAAEGGLAPAAAVGGEVVSR